MLQHSPSLFPPSLLTPRPHIIDATLASQTSSTQQITFWHKTWFIWSQLRMSLPGQSVACSLLTSQLCVRANFAPPAVAGSTPLCQREIWVTSCQQSEQLHEVSVFCFFPLRASLRCGSVRFPLLAAAVCQGCWNSPMGAALLSPAVVLHVQHVYRWKSLLWEPGVIRHFLFVRGMLEEGFGKRGAVKEQRGSSITHTSSWTVTHAVSQIKNTELNMRRAVPW